MRHKNSIQTFGKYQKRRSPSANAEGLLLLHFQGIRPENPDQLPSFSGIPHRLPRPTGTAVPDGKYNVCMVYHILVPLSQTVRRVLPLQHRLLVAPLCDGEVAIPQGFRPPHRLRRLWRVAALHSCRVVLASPKNNLIICFVRHLIPGAFIHVYIIY